MLSGGFLIGVWNGGRVIALQQSMNQIALHTRLDPRLRLIIALIWAVLFIGMTVALWQKRPFSRRIIPILIFCYGLVDLSLLAFGIRNPLNQQSWLIEVMLYTGLTLFSYWALNRPATILYFSHKESLETK